MDLNYILKREQESLYRAANSKSASARVVHGAFARAYGLLLAASTFPHNALQSDEERRVLREKRTGPDPAIDTWEGEGGNVQVRSSE